MRSFLSMLKELIIKGLLVKSTVKADKIALYRFANLANRLRFKSLKIAALKIILIQQDGKDLNNLGLCSS